MRHREKYTLLKKNKLGKLVEKLNKEYDEEGKPLDDKTRCDYKRKKACFSETKARLLR